MHNEMNLNFPTYLLTSQKGISFDLRRIFSFSFVSSGSARSRRGVVLLLLLQSEDSCR